MCKKCLINFWYILSEIKKNPHLQKIAKVTKRKNCQNLGFDIFYELESQTSTIVAKLNYSHYLYYKFVFTIEISN